MERNLEERFDVPPAIRTIENASMKNPLFLEALKRTKNPKEREEILAIFRDYLTRAYNNDPRMNRLMKTHDIADRINYASENEDYDGKAMLQEQLYSDPGRSYHYTNNILGNEKKKKSIARRVYDTTRDLTFETLPGIVGTGGWFGAKKWYSKRMAEEAAERSLATVAGKKGLEGLVGAFKGMKWYEYNPLGAGIRLAKGLSSGAGAAAGEVAGEVASDSLLHSVGRVLTPAKYLLGGYFIYKTIKYFMKKHKEKKKLNELNRQVWLQNQILGQMI